MFLIYLHPKVKTPYKLNSLCKKKCYIGQKSTNLSKELINVGPQMLIIWK